MSDEEKKEAPPGRIPGFVAVHGMAFVTWTAEMSPDYAPDQETVVLAVSKVLNSWDPVEHEKISVTLKTLSEAIITGSDERKG